MPYGPHCMAYFGIFFGSMGGGGCQKFSTSFGSETIIVYIYICLQSPAPRAEYKRPLISKMHPKIHPESSPETKIWKITKKRTKVGGFRRFFVILSYFGFGRGFGVYFGVYLRDQRAFVFCTGHRRSQAYVRLRSPF